MATGREERRKSKEGQARRPNLDAFYNRPMTDVTPGEFDFTVSLLGGARKPIPLDKALETLGWEDSGDVLSGKLDLRRPDHLDLDSLPIGRGMRVRCKVRWRGAWVELWTMRTGFPDTDLTEGTVSISLSDDLEPLKRNKRKRRYRKTKRRPRAWKAHEVAAAVLKEEGIRPGQIAEGQVKLSKIEMESGTALEVLQRAYEQEEKKTTRKFVLRLRNGRVDIVPYRRNRVLYQFSEQIEGASHSQEGKERPFTVLEAKGRIGKGKAARKIKHTEYRRDVVRRFGRITHEKDYGRVDSLAELRKEAKLDYAKELRTTRTASLTIPGIPFIRRGDGLRWVNRENGWYGRTHDVKDRSYVYCTAVSHSVTSEGYTTTLSVDQVDPFLKDLERRDKETREKARRRRNRRR